MAKKAIPKIQVDFDKLKKTMGLPFKIPIVFESSDCGTLIIDYISKPITRLEDGEKFWAQVARIDAFKEVLALSRFWKRDIELSLVLKTIYMAKNHSLLRLLNSYDYGGEIRKKGGGRDVFPLGDDIVLEFVESQGPSALRVMGVIVVLLRWLADPKRAGMRLEKLGDALVHHQTGKRMGEIRFPDGRPPSSSIEYVGPTIIKAIYEDLKSFLKLAKKIKGQEHFDNRKEDTVRLKKLIEDSSSAYLAILEAEAIKRPEDQKIQARIRRFNDMTGNKAQGGPYSFVLSCLQNDPELLAEFSIRYSKPNLMAKRIIGKLVGVSSETISNVLRPRPAKRKNISD